MVKRPKEALKNQENHTESSVSDLPGDTVDPCVTSATDSGKEPKAEDQKEVGFSPLDLLRCMDDPFPSNRPVRVASLSSLRGRS